MTVGIYKITNRHNGKFYIGRSIDIESRVYAHKRNLKNNTHCCKQMQEQANAT